MIIRKWISLVLCLFMMPSFAHADSEQDTRSLLSAFMSYTDLRINGVGRSLEILAASTEARSGDWETMKGLLDTYQKSDEGLVVWYVRPDGSYYTVDKGMMTAKLSDRSYFAGLMAGNKISGSLVVSKSTGQRSAVIAIPIKQGDKVIGAIGASLFLDKLAEQINSVLVLRTDISFFALASDGLTALHRKAERHFLDPRELGSETLKNAANEMLAGTNGAVSYQFDNTEKKAIYMTSPLTQWKFALAFSAAQKNK